MEIGRVISAGFALVQRAPGAVAVWTLIGIALHTVGQLSAFTMFRGMMALPSSRPDLEAMLGSFGLVYAVQLGVLVVQIILWGAVFRAMFRPRESSFAYLRLGGDELRLFLIGLLMGVGSLIAMALVFGIGATAGIFSTSANAAQGIGIVLLIFLMTFGLFIGFIFLGVRLAMVWPLAVAERSIQFGTAWRLSSGRFWAMFAAALVLIIGLSVAGQIAGSVQLGGIFAVMQEMSGDAEAMNRAVLEQFATINVYSVISWVLGGIVSTAWIVAMGAGISNALMQARPATGDELAATFA